MMNPSVDRALTNLLYKAIKFFQGDRQVWLIATIIQTRETSDLPTLP